MKKKKNKSIENYLFNAQNSIPMFSDFFRNFFANDYNFKVGEFKNYKRSLDFLFQFVVTNQLIHMILNDAVQS